LGIKDSSFITLYTKAFTMELLRYEITAGFFKGVLFGIRHYPFEDEQIYEEDIVIYFGIFQLIITKIYRK
jgi:hypothetical protein